MSNSESLTARLREAIEDYASARESDCASYERGYRNNDAKAARADLDALLAELEAALTGGRGEGRKVEKPTTFFGGTGGGKHLMVNRLGGKWIAVVGYSLEADDMAELLDAIEREERR